MDNASKGGERPSKEQVTKLVTKLSGSEQAATPNTPAFQKNKWDAILQDPQNILGTQANVDKRATAGTEVVGSAAWLEQKQADFAKWLDSTPEGQAFQRVKMETPGVNQDWRKSTVEVKNWLNSEAGKAFLRLKGRVVDQDEQQL